jgi:serine/threonine-protein kinase
MVGAELWELLSQGLEEKVSKKSFRAALERRTDIAVTAVGATSPDGVEDAIDLEFPEDQVQLGSKFYIDRPPIESRCYQTVVKPGSLIWIKAPRQMGKSSLMVRVLDRAAQQGYRTATLNFQLADSKIFADLDRLLKWFCATISRNLELPNQVADYWDDIFGAKTSCKDYFERYLLAKLEQPLVLALEEVDYIFPHPDLSDDFFSLLRSWHEEAKNSEVWQKLRLVLAHSTEVYIPLNINQSPFNVGLAVELPEFIPSQVEDLARRHGLDWNCQEVDRLMETIGGHPYLVRVALYHLVQQNATLEELLQEAPTEAGSFSDRLRRHLGNLQQQSNLAAAMKMVLETSSPVRLESVEMFKLHSMGLVNLQGNEVTPRCQLYRQFFGDRLTAIG